MPAKKPRHDTFKIRACFDKPGVVIEGSKNLQGKNVIQRTIVYSIFGDHILLWSMYWD